MAIWDVSAIPPSLCPDWIRWRKRGRNGRSFTWRIRSARRVGCGPALRRHASAGSRPFCLSCAFGVLDAHRLAHVLNSLVRVSRRVGRSARNHTTRTPRAPWHRAARQAARATAELRAVHRRRPQAHHVGPLPEEGVRRGRSSPARSANAATACNTTRERVATLPPGFSRPDGRSSCFAAAKCTCRTTAAG